MFKKLLNNREDFEKWINKVEEILHNDSFDWNNCAAPENYPCIVAWCIVDEMFYENDSLYHEFIYLTDFK